MRRSMGMRGRRGKEAGFERMSRAVQPIAASTGTGWTGAPSYATRAAMSQTPPRP